MFAAVFVNSGGAGARSVARRVPARGSVAGRARENPYPLTSFAHRGFRVGFPNLGGIPLLSPAGDLYEAHPLTPSRAQT